MRLWVGMGVGNWGKDGEEMGREEREFWNGMLGGKGWWMVLGVGVEVEELIAVAVGDFSFRMRDAGGGGGVGVE